ncbi:hypothetical protein SOMG_00221 [Schizosaccharomyces osmophilus]|uniref:Uncharacterized protein n=1 Tax=Schizosaccharomyces osmophilus TaxID=2545709 RepID=A0AAE9WD09_9SCHI|nr:uncharacterized protein SOMG_00221 [Schizosaccharomyces osmophilus]WBW72912.1 hypothetical protein SOMG_00221 [Schizosaccharomyces osmophilus]
MERTISVLLPALFLVKQYRKFWIENLRQKRAEISNFKNTTSYICLHGPQASLRRLNTNSFVHLRMSLFPCFTKS